MTPDQAQWFAIALLAGFAAGTWFVVRAIKLWLNEAHEMLMEHQELLLPTKQHKPPRKP